MPETPTTDLLRTSGLAGLGEDPPPEAVEAALRELATVANGSDPLGRATLREGAVRLLKDAGVRSPARMVDAALTTEDDREGNGGSRQGHALTLSDPEPWPDPVDGAALLEALVRTFTRYLALPDGAATALALRTVHAHAHVVAVVSAILALVSPEKRCGKTTTLHLLGALVPRPLPASNITTAALFRAVEHFRPTLLVDEADTFLQDREELRGVLNSGHARAGAIVVRTVGDDYEPRTFSTWAPKAIALIGDLPGTLEDRAVVVRMRRRAPGEEVERLRLDRLHELEPLRRKLARWTEDNADRLREADPELPDGLHDRARDNWRPLVAIADAAGGVWPERARKAAGVLSGAEAGEDSSAGVMLLSDLRDLFEARNVDRLASKDITDALAEMEERPWPEWRRGNPLTARSLARLLKPFGPSPKQLRVEGEKVRGYELEDFRDAFRRYLPTGDPPPEAVHPVQSNDGAGSSGFPKRYTPASRTGSENAQNPHETTDVPDVPDGDPPSGERVGVPDLLDDLEGA